MCFFATAFKLAHSSPVCPSRLLDFQCRGGWLKNKELEKLKISSHDGELRDTALVKMPALSFPKRSTGLVIYSNNPIQIFMTNWSVYSLVTVTQNKPILQKQVRCGKIGRRKGRWNLYTC